MAYICIEHDHTPPIHHCMDHIGVDIAVGRVGFHLGGPLSQP